MARARRTDQGTGELAFLVGGQPHLVRADRVVEVLRTPFITRVPLTPPAIAGVINFHGAPLPVLRLDRLLDLVGDLPTAVPPRVIVYADPEPVGLLVDAVVSLGGSTGKRGGPKALDLAALLRSRLGDLGTAGAGERTLAMPVETIEPSAVAAGRTLLSFRVAGQRYALPLECVREVMPLPTDIAPMPGSGAAVIGLASMRDTVVPLISLAHLLGLGDQAAAGPQYVVVTRIGTRSVGLVTAAMDKVFRLAETSIEPVPDLLRGAGVAELEAIGRLEGGRQLVSILSPDKLLGNEIVAGAVAKIDQGGDGVATAVAEAASAQFVVLVLGDERFGLPITAVDEIIQLPAEVTRVPRAPAFLSGVVNLRGTPLPIIDQRKRFETASSDSTRRARVVVVNLEGTRAGFIVDGVSEIVRVRTADIRPAPKLPGAHAGAFDRVTPFGDDGEMLLLIDRRELLNRAERDLLSHLKLPERAAGS